MPRQWIFLFAVLSAASMHAETKWIHMHSPNFEVYSCASEGATRDTLRYFEQVRSFFLQVMAQPEKEAEKPVPVYIVAFGSEKEYAPYRFNEVALAYYHGGADRDYIVMGKTGIDTFPIATHEYVHLIAQHAGLKFPPWLNEGMAELYSTLQPQGGKILVGNLIRGRVYGLMREKWVPLSIILTADHSSSYYNEKNKAGRFYDESWALVHMLMLSPEYRPRFSAVMADIQNGTPSIQALEKTYGKPLDAIEKDLQLYLRGDRFSGVIFPARLTQEKTVVPVEPASPFDVKLTLAEMSDGAGKETETQKRFEELAKDDPKRPEPWASLAYLAWRSGDHKQAEEHFGKAFTLGDRNPRLLWDYGRMAERDHPADSIQALKELSAAQPDRLEVKLELASVQLSSKQAPAALATLRMVKKITSTDAPRLFLLTAYAALQTGDRDEARAATDRYATYAKSPEDRKRADDLKRYLSVPTPPALPVETAGVVSERPKLIRRDSAVEIDEPPAPSVMGTFVELLCLDVQAKMVLQTAQGKQIYLIQDPRKITVVGREGGKVDMQCGPQKALPIRIEYAPAESGSDVDGLVRIIYFEP
jgi:Flp pilus assembly protein TadD